MGCIILSDLRYGNCIRTSTQFHDAVPVWPDQSNFALMKLVNDKIRLFPTDLSTHLGCVHATELERLVVVDPENHKRPHVNNPSLEALAERGREHEAAYVKYLKDSGLKVVEMDMNAKVNETIAHMEDGVDVIVQAVLADDTWNGRADILLKVDKPSRLGAWSYEVQDTKLALDTKAGTILQLCVYADIVEMIQHRSPELLWVVKPGTPFEKESFRYDDFKAYFRRTRQSFLETINSGPQNTYPEPVDQCSICRWWRACDAKRHADDHPSLIAGIHKMHISELRRHDIFTLEQFANRDQPLPQPPLRGNAAAYTKVHHQARIQLKGRGREKPIHELLPLEAHRGLYRLPEPDAGDVYFDIEGDPFYPGGGIEYLLGVVIRNENGELIYKRYWAKNLEEEKQIFGEFMRFLLDRWTQFPDMHIYHYSPYEPSAIKRLASKHALHEEDNDRLLRGLRYIDLHAISKETLRASVERYSLKDLEKFTDYIRKVDLALAGPARRNLEFMLEFRSGLEIDPQLMDMVQDYNEDDCRATHALHVWLEGIRSDEIGKGVSLPRPVPKDDKPSETQSLNQEKRNTLFQKLVRDIPSDSLQRTPEQRAKWLLAHLVHYFNREEKTNWWEYYAREDLDFDALFNERKAIAGLEFVCELPKEGQQSVSRQRYRLPPQEISISKDNELREIRGGEKWGSVLRIDTDRWEIDVVKTRKSKDIHPSAVHIKEGVTTAKLEASLMTIGDNIATHGFEAAGHETAKQLLLQLPPRFIGYNGGPILRQDEDPCDGAIRAALALDNSVLAIQGPPGTGKTHAGALMILALVKAGKKVGVTAVSHKVINNLLSKVYELAGSQSVALVHKDDSGDPPEGVLEVGNDAAYDHLHRGAVVGGTAWLWAVDAAAGKADYLFVDEAGQMSLAMVIAASRGCRNLILLGDPQQLEQPQRGAHPEGADVAALTHLLEGRNTIPEDKGIFLGMTRRLHPKITAFTSEIYYEGKLLSQRGLENMKIIGDSPFAGAGLFYVPVNHVANQNRSDEEVAAICDLVRDLTTTNLHWTNRKGETIPITNADILVVAPYNAQVAALADALPGFRVGTVDKFQGQEAAIVIYSMTTSSAEDAPRGMSFLYSPNRFNVATSRALVACILVATKTIFSAECRTIEQMKWVNGVCRYGEMGVLIGV